MVTRRQIADDLEIGIETLRYWEKIGLIPSPERLDNNYRVYSKKDILCFKFILKLKTYGFKLDEISHILNAIGKQQNNKGILKSNFLGKLNVIERKIEELKKTKSILEFVLESPNFGNCDFFEIIEKSS